jgi:hypothetical protein
LVQESSKASHDARLEESDVESFKPTPGKEEATYNGNPPQTIIFEGEEQRVEPENERIIYRRDLTNSRGEDR